MSEGHAVTAEGIARCEALARGHYENFRVATFAVPASYRPDVRVLYAYARTVDDLGDEAEGDREALLDVWEEDVLRCWESDGRPSSPILAALADTVRRRDLPREPFLDLVEANRRDQRVHRYATFDELRDYCRVSADPCGRMFLALFGYRDPERIALSDRICTALQLANFWQDVGIDYRKGRVYLPREDLDRFGVVEASIASCRRDAAFRELMAFQIARARSWFDAGEGLRRLLPARLGLQIGFFLEGGRRILESIERSGYDVLSNRRRLGRWDRTVVILRALFGGGGGRAA